MTPPDSPADAPAASTRRAPVAVRWLWGALAASVLLPTLMLAYVGWDSYQTTMNDGATRLARVAQIAQEQASRVVETNEVLWRSIDRTIGTQPAAALAPRRADLHTMLRDLGTGLHQLQSIWIWDPEGRPVASSLRADPPAALSVLDREYFQHAMQVNDDAWYVSQPLRSRATGEPFFDFTRRRTAPDGRFLGVVSISLYPDYFNRFFGELARQDPAFSITLLRADGVIISRYPGVALQARLGAGSPLLKAMQAGLATGQTSGRSTLDGRERLVAYRRIGNLPLYAAATADRELLLAHWQRSILLLAAFTVPLTAGLAALCWFALQRVRREQAIAQAHQEQYEQRLRAEEALRQAQKMEALGRLTGGVAHDFNNILMVVQSSVALARKLEERGKPPGQALDAMQRAVNTGAQLTRQLLAIARRQPLQVTTVRLQDVVPELAALMRSTLGRDVQVLAEVEPDVPAVVVDQAEFQLALINLCINARDAMPAGGHIWLRAERGAAGQALVHVRDEGQGIPAQLLDKVLEPFFTTKPIGKGTGLGLSQVQTFVQQAGGAVRIDSAVGRGTTVTLDLPAAEDQAAQAPAAGAVPLRNLRGRILLVEDHADIATSLSVLLQEAGLQVFVHAAAETALSALRAPGAAIDAVLSDISLGNGLTGVDLATICARDWPDLPVVLMTGYTDRLDEAVRRGLRVLAKPVAPEALLDELARVLEKRSPAAKEADHARA